VNESKRRSDRFHRATTRMPAWMAIRLKMSCVRSIILHHKGNCGSGHSVADEVGAFAQHVVQLHRDPKLWNRLSRSGIQTIKEHLSMAAATRGVHRLLSQVNVIPDGSSPLSALPGDVKASLSKARSNPPIPVQRRERSPGGVRWMRI
jgi:hypothetical protein